MKKIILLAFVLAPLTMLAQQKFGRVNTGTIIQAMPEYTKAQSEMQTLEKQYQDELVRMQEEGKKKADDFEKEAANLPENIKQRRANEIQEISQKIQQYYAESQENLRKSEEEKLQPIQKKLMEAINAVGKEGGYVFIITDGSFPYISETAVTDVTAAVKTKLGIK